MKINKAKKSAEAATYIMFAIAIALSVGVFTLGLYSIHFIKERFAFHIKEDITKVNNEFIILDILRAPVSDNTIADLAVESYLNDDYDELEKELKQILKAYFDEEPPWELFIDNQRKKHNCYIRIHDCEGKRRSYEALLPLINTKEKSSIMVKFYIYKR